MKKRKEIEQYERYLARHHKKRKKGTLFVFILIIGALIYIYLAHGGSFSFINLNNFTSSLNSNSLIQICNQKVTNCGQIISEKYESNLTILKTSQFNTSLGADSFLKTWGSGSQSSDISYYDANFPVILVATRLDNSDGSKTPHVFVCKSDGTLEDKSSAGLC